MTFGSRIPGAALLVLATVLAFPVPAVAQLRVIISGGFSAAYKELIPEFERTSGISVVTASGSSQGDGPTTIGAQLRSGALFDVVILNTTGLADLMGLRRQKVRECGGAATEGQGASRDSRKADIREWRLLAVSGYQSPGRSSARI